MKSMKLTDIQLDALRHMLGINTPDVRVPVPTRNYAAVCPGDAQFAELERLDAVECYSRKHCEEFPYDYFRCTPAGKAAALVSNRKIRYSKSARRYCTFLSMKDCYQDLTFHQFLTLPYFAEFRRNA